MLYKKAAMFGLDARIALAIFGALSVIAGAAMYKAVDEVKTAQYHNFFEELVKASEAYYLDNGQPLPRMTGNDYTLYGSDLLANRESLSTWKGPYISSIFRIDDDSFDTDYTGYGQFLLFKKSTWTGTALSTRSCVVDAIDCAEWISVHLNTVSSQEWGSNAFNKLDKSIDNSDGGMAGKIRYIEIDVNNHYICFQGIPRVRRV